jgi:hypothetical protein
MHWKAGDIPFYPALFRDIVHPQAQSRSKTRTGPDGYWPDRVKAGLFCAPKTSDVLRERIREHLVDGLGQCLATPRRIGGWCRTCGENSLRLMIEALLSF